MQGKRCDCTSKCAILLFESKKFEIAEKLFALDKKAVSQSFLLKCFYELDKEAKFYEQFDYMVKKGLVNCVMGSYIFRAERRYGRKIENSFCNEPYKYVKKIDLKEQCDFKNIFIKTANDILTDQTVKHKSQGHLKNGIQTAGNIFNQVGSVTDQMQNIIRSELEKYQRSFGNSKEGFIKKWPKNYSISGWLVSMKSGGELAAHIHDTGWVTGSIYINVPPKSKTESGNLVVTTDDQKNSVDGVENRKSLNVVTGSMCLFPSSLLHYTVPFDSDEDRIVLAFDIIPEP